MNRDKIADKLVELAGEIRGGEEGPKFDGPGVYVYYPPTGDSFSLIVKLNSGEVRRINVPIDLWGSFPGMNHDQTKKVRIVGR